MGLKNIKEKIKSWSFFNRMFGFENGVDITDDTQVLYRKNIVIKNIIFISNWIYTLIFMIISFGEPSNWVLTIICFPLTFFINNALKKMIARYPKDIAKQQIAMYISCLYMFLTAILMYIKLKFGGEGNLAEVGYILLYYSLIICSLYQDKKLLKNVFEMLLVIVTVLHFTLTYNVIGADYATNLEEFITKFFVSPEFKDIFLRTVILCIFYLVLYSIVSMSAYMQDERKKELIKRRETQEEFTNVVTNIFAVTLNKQARSKEELNEISLIAEMSEKLASLAGLQPEKCGEIARYAKIHVEEEVYFHPSELMNEDEKYEFLRKQTSIGSIIIKRIELERKCEDIIRAHMELSATPEFIDRMKTIQNNMESQIVMLCDMYVTLRSIRSYKKAYSHKNAMQYLEEEFRQYYDATLFERFVKFQDSFEEIYDK